MEEVGWGELSEMKNAPTKSNKADISAGGLAEIFIVQLLTQALFLTL